MDKRIIIKPYHLLLMAYSLAGVLWLGTVLSPAAVHYVTPPGGYGTNNPPYTNWADAATNIQDAVNAAESGETIYVTNGSYCVTNQIALVSNITLRSMNGWSNTLVYLDWPAYTSRCFYVSNSVVDGFAVSNGHFYSSASVPGGGGAFIASNGLMQNCYFVGNVASSTYNYGSGGGGAYINKGMVSNCIFFTNCALGSPSTYSGNGGAIDVSAGYVLNCTIISNYCAYHGGGINASSAIISNCPMIAYNRNLNSAGGGLYGSGTCMVCVIRNNSGFGGGGAYWGGLIADCVIINNTEGSSATGGGGLYLSSGSASNCVIAGNRPSNQGTAGGVAVGGGVIERCVISNNMSDGIGRGVGGVILGAGSGIMRNCLIHHNTNASAAGYGGGVYLTNSASKTPSNGLINCTIVNNHSVSEGGGVAAGGISNYIANCIIASNTSAGGNYPNVYHRNNLDANSSNYYYTCVITTDANLLAVNQGNITNDPVFANPPAGDWRITPRSPCFNAGLNQTWMTNSYDLDGRGRIRYNTVDMGAYEAIYEGTIYHCGF
jgi:hypothetical protein